MTVKFKPGLHVVTADGSELVLIDRAPVTTLIYSDTGLPVSTRAYVRSYTGEVLAATHREYRRVRTSGPGKGSAWWAQRADTGELLRRSVRESEMSPLTDSAVMSA